MGVVGLTHKYILNKKAVISSTVSWSGTDVSHGNTEPIDSGLYSETNSFKKGYLRANVQLNQKFNARHFLSSGITASYLSYNFNSTYSIPENGILNEFLDFANDKGSSGSAQAFTSWKFRPNERLTLVNGVHILHFFLSQETVVEPRSNIRWQFHPKTAVFAGFGLHSRIESLEYYFAKNNQNNINYNSDLGVTRSTHFVLGFDTKLSPKVYMKAEAYFQNLYNVPVLAETVNPGDPLSGAFSSINLSNGYITEDLVNGGAGTNYGLELTLERKFTEGYFFLINGMLYESKYKGRDGITRNTRYNGNFGYNLLAGKEYEVGRGAKNHILGLNLKLAHAGNKRFTPIELDASRQAGRQVVLPQKLFSKRFNDYFRADVQVSYRKNLTNKTIEWRLDIQNVTVHNNALDIYYDASTEQIIVPEERIFIPVLSYRIEF